MAKILIIDDSWLTRRGLTGMITGLSHDVIEAENGKIGLDVMEEERPDCVFLDLLMPELDGYQVLEILKEKNNKIPIVVCTADIQDTARKRCLSLGADGFLNKPPKEKEIVSALQKALE